VCGRFNHFTNPHLFTEVLGGIGGPPTTLSRRGMSSASATAISENTSRLAGTGPELRQGCQDRFVVHKCPRRNSRHRACIPLSFQEAAMLGHPNFLAKRA
jgi:hypothetical protein